MLEKFFKKSTWTDIIISIIFAFLGIILISKPDIVQSALSYILATIFIAVGVFRIIEYYKYTSKDNYVLGTAILSIIVGIIVLFCTGFILSIFRIIIGLWIIYTGIINMQTALVWKKYSSKVWLLTVILALLTIIAGIYVVVSTGIIVKTIGVIILVYAIMNILDNAIFMKYIEGFKK